MRREMSVDYTHGDYGIRRVNSSGAEKNGSANVKLRWEILNIYGDPVAVVATLREAKVLIQEQTASPNLAHGIIVSRLVSYTTPAQEMNRFLASVRRHNARRWR